MRKEKGAKTKILNNKKERDRIIFCCVILALPVLQQLIFYVGVNFNSFLQAFQIYENSKTGIGFDITFSLTENFKKAIELGNYVLFFTSY